MTQIIPKTAQAYYDELVQRTKDGLLPATINRGLTCCYRQDYDPNSNIKCVAGILIPNEKYEKEFEGINLNTQHCTLPSTSSVIQRRLIESLQIPNNMTLEDVHALQTFHDDKPANFRKTFIENINNLPCFVGCQLTTLEA